MKTGIVNINKPAGFTSHDVVNIVRKKFGMRRVGHAGTLDPLATGVLILLIGNSTKLFQEFVSFDKAYRSTLLLGRTTTTADIQGQTIRELPWEQCGTSQIQSVFKDFCGNLKQIPPMVSAIKIKGKKLYNLARAGIEVERIPRDIRIDILSIENIALPHIQFYVECSKGTYIRQLAEDIGEKLGCGACLSQIQRTKVGPFTLDHAVTLEDLNESHIQSWSA